MSKSNEAFFWSLFSAGGVVSALFIPVLIVLTGLILPAGDAAARYERLHALVAHPLTKIVLLVVFFLTFFHCAHRIQHTSKDLGLRPIGGLIAALCYLGAVAGTVTAGVVLWGIR